jgi:sugar-specific transcriptional regulator TrmB
VFRRDPFRDVIRRQLDLFENDEAELIAEVREAERAYDKAPREDAEAAYEQLWDMVETGTEMLAEIRDSYMRTLDEETAEHLSGGRFGVSDRDRLAYLRDLGVMILAQNSGPVQGQGTRSTGSFPPDGGR